MGQNAKISRLPVFPPAAIPRIFSSISPLPPQEKNRETKTAKKPRCKWKCSEISKALRFEEVGHKLNLSEMSRSLVQLANLPWCQPVSPQLCWMSCLLSLHGDLFLFKQRSCCCEFDMFVFTSNKRDTWLLLDIE